ncbi:Titin-like [Holothuria leucospilota]|uniref:Titin-like n=1 Tax=Holothuria leucospilota TaxID=206669 RepID=A0A9Q1CLK8_HOLLE|nr:Titin-like [Holothuria leucospilota]
MLQIGSTRTKELSVIPHISYILTVLPFQKSFLCKPLFNLTDIFADLSVRNRNPVTAFIGDRVSLVCEGSYQWEAVEIYWLYNGLPVSDVRPLYDVTEVVNSLETFTTSTLTINNARKFDHGQFTCASSDMPGRATVMVNIYAEPQLRPIPDVTLQYGGSLVLTCHVIPLIQEASMYWSKNGELIGTTGTHDLDGDRKIDGEVLRNGSLIVYAADKTDAGLYTCLLRYIINRRSETISANVNVNAAVEVTIKEYIKMNSPLFEPIKITCTAFGYPVPEISWQFKNFTIGGDGFWGRDIDIIHRPRSPISVTSEITIGDLPGTFAMASVRCDGKNFFSNASQLSLIIKFGNGSVALLDGSHLEDASLLVEKSQAGRNSSLFRILIILCFVIYTVIK